MKHLSTSQENTENKSWTSHKKNCEQFGKKSLKSPDLIVNMLWTSHGLVIKEMNSSWTIHEQATSHEQVMSSSSEVVKVILVILVILVLQVLQWELN